MLISIDIKYTHIFVYVSFYLFSLGPKHYKGRNKVNLKDSSRPISLRPSSCSGILTDSESHDYSN